MPFDLLKVRHDRNVGLFIPGVCHRPPNQRDVVLAELLQVLEPELAGQRLPTSRDRGGRRKFDVSAWERVPSVRSVEALPYIRPQHGKPACPRIRLPGLQYPAQIPHHPRRVPSPPPLRVAEHAPHAMRNHLDDLAVPAHQGPLSDGLAVRQNRPPVARQIPIDQNPVGDPAVPRERRIHHELFPSRISLEAQRPAPIRRVEPPGQHLLLRRGMCEVEIQRERIGQACRRRRLRRRRSHSYEKKNFQSE